MKKRLLGLVLLVLLLLIPSQGYGEPKEETEEAITDLQERLLQLNDAISTNLVKQQEQEAAIRVLESTENKQATEVVQATERLERLEKDIQERLKAIQLKEADQKTRVLQVENWSAALKALYSAETIRKSDEARGKEYQQLSCHSFRIR